MNTMHFTNRFDPEDFVYLFHFIVNTVLIAYLAINVGSCANKYAVSSYISACPEFSGIVAALRFVQVGFLIYVLYYNTRYATVIKKKVLKGARG